MATLETLLAEYVLVLERRDLREIYTRLETEEDWHRLSQRVYVLNKTWAKRLGVRFVIHREKGCVRVYFASPDKLAALLSSLREGRGFVQKSLAERLESKASQVSDRRSVPKRLRDLQTALLKEMLSRDLGLFAGADLDSILVETAGSAGTTISQIGGLLPGSGLILGESGSGKTALLYSLLRNWDRLGAKTSAHTPVYVSAKHLHFEWGRFDIPWAALPGVEANMVERLEAAFEEGRLALLIDGINENPSGTDFTNPAVQSFWKTAARNCCVITTLPRFYESHVKVSPLRSFFAAGLSPVTLGTWGPALYRALFERLAAGLRRSGSPQLGMLAGNLDKISIEDWQRASPLLRLTPLTGLACANFFVHHQGERLPKDEYELMEHMTAFHLRHEGFKGNVVSASETVLGLLMRLAWQAYVEGRGGKFSCISTDDASRVIRESYPMLEERRSEVFHFLSQLPHLEFSPENGLFYMNQQFADYLAAKYLILTFIAGDSKRLKAALESSWDTPHMSRLYLLGISALGKAEKAQFLHVTRGLYDAYRQEGRAPPVAGPSADPGRGIVVARLLQPLGFLDTSEAADFLWSVFNESQSGAELTLMSASIGLAWAGEPKALELYVERLRKTPKAAQFNLNWYLFFRRHDRFRRDIENFRPEAVGRWEPVCDWLLGAMLRTDRDFKPLRLLYAYSFCNFLKTLGPRPFRADIEENGTGAAKSAERLKLVGQVAAAWLRDPQLKAWPALERQFSEMTGLMSKYQHTGGHNGTTNGSKGNEDAKKERLRRPPNGVTA